MIYCKYCLLCSSQKKKKKKKRNSRRTYRAERAGKKKKKKNGGCCQSTAHTHKQHLLLPGINISSVMLSEKDMKESIHDVYT